MIRIITDSAADLKNDFAKENNIIVLPMHVKIGDVEYKDGVDLTGREFFLKLVEMPDLPKTSQIPPFEFEGEFEKYPDDEIICITMSSKLSGTCQSAMLASQEFSNVSVVDSLNVTCGEKILIIYALQLIEKGLTRLEIVEELNRVKTKIVVLGLLDTLEFLKRGGRISALKAALGTMLHVKPVIEIKNGLVEMAGKARGSMNGQNMLREITKKYGCNFDMPIALAYSGLSDDLLKKYIEDSKDVYGENFGFDTCLIGSTIGTHIGPNAIAVAFYIK